MVMTGASASAGFTAAEPLGGPATQSYRLNRYFDAAITDEVPSRSAISAANRRLKTWAAAHSNVVVEAERSGTTDGGTRR